MRDRTCHGGQCSLVERRLVGLLAHRALVSTAVSSGSRRGTSSRRVRTFLAHCWVLRDRAWLISLSDRPHPLNHQGLPGRHGPRRCRPYLENYTVDASIFVARQATKGTWWMPWHQEPMKDVGACDKPREVGNRAVIRGFPNGETQLESCPVTSA